MKCSCDCNPALVSKRSNDETSCSSHVLITVVECCKDLLDFKRIVINALRIVLIVVESKLLLPSEIFLVADVILLQGIDDVTSMYILSDKGH